MESDQPNTGSVLAIVHIVVAEMPDKSAYGATNAKGERVVYADRTVLDGDAVARENAFRVFVAQAGAAMNAPAVKIA